MNKFVHLRNYSQYSLSKGALRLNDLAKFCLNNRFPAISISDFDNLFGALEFSLECRNFGIQPIIGCNLYLKSNKLDDGYVLLICKDKVGYQNLLALASKSYLVNSDYCNPYITFDDLANFNKGLICLAGGEFGIINKNLSKNKDNAKSLLDYFRKIFKDDFFIEVQKTNSKLCLSVNDFLVNVSLDSGIPIVATNENFFLKSDFYDSHDALLCISQQKYIDSEDRIRSSKDFYIKSSDEMYNLFSDLKIACENTVLIAQKCSYFPVESKPKLPKLSNEKISENQLLIKHSYEGLKKRISEFGIKNKSQYIVRLNYELKVITKMGFSGYFLIVADFIKWSKNNDIPVGPGRGSGAGSLVAWCLLITNLDPIKFGLLFERFLNPERVSMPDFDVDFCMQGRDKVIDYVQKKYGFDNVAQIITFGSFQAKAAIRDVGRVMQLPLPLIDDICKMIPFNPAKPLTLDEFLSENSQIKKIIKNNPDIKKLFNHAKRFEGLLRHASTHAAGIVISDKKLNEIVPLYKDPKSDIPVTQYSMKYVEKVGLIKFDFLGLKTLTVINDTCKILKKNKVNIEINQIPLDDNKTFNMLKKGLTTGVFQLEGQGMKETIMKVMPDRFEDLIAIVSLYRPGPMDNIPTYVSRKHQKESVSYVHNALKEILDETYGIMVYQEQVMLIAQKVAGFSLAKADLLRRAMGKKIKSEMDAQKSNFVDGCLKNAINRDQAESLFNEIAKFAGYGFNKSHAAAYAMIAYQTAYLKANYPIEFFCSLMNCDINNSDKLSVYCDEVKQLGFSVISPDISYSETEFLVVDKKNGDRSIAFGLGALKNIGENSIKEIIKDRKINGKFKNLSDLLQRISNNILNKKILEALIYSNSLKSLEVNQKFLNDKIEDIISLNSNYHKNLNIHQNTLFTEENLFDERLNSSDYDSWSQEYKLEKELEVIGFYLSDHPTKKLKLVFQNLEVKNLSNLKDQISKSTLLSESYIAVINEINERTSKKGKRFCFFSLADDTGQIDAICFSEVLESLNFELKKGKVYNFKISTQVKNENRRFIINNIKDLLNRTNLIENYLIKLDTHQLNIKKVNNFFNDCGEGNSNLSFLVKFNDYEILVRSNKKFDLDYEFLNKASTIKGILINKDNKNS